MWACWDVDVVGCSGDTWACRRIGVWTRCLAGTIACGCVGMQAPGMCMQTWRTVADQCKEKRKAYLLMWMLDGNVDAWACRRVGVQARWRADADGCGCGCVNGQKNTYLITQMVACVGVQRDGVRACVRAWCTHADTDEGKGEKKRTH